MYLLVDTCTSKSWIIHKVPTNKKSIECISNCDHPLHLYCCDFSTEETQGSQRAVIYSFYPARGQSFHLSTQKENLLCWLTSCIFLNFPLRQLRKKCTIKVYKGLQVKCLCQTKKISCRWSWSHELILKELSFEEICISMNVNKYKGNLSCFYRIDK